MNKLIIRFLAFDLILIIHSVTFYFLGEYLTEGFQIIGALGLVAVVGGVVMVSIVKEDF